MNMSSILDSLPQAPSDGASYALLAVAIILGLYLIKKVIKIITFIIIFGAVGIALAALNGTDISGITDPVVTYATQLYTEMNSKVDSATGGATSSGSLSSGEDNVKKMISDFAKKK